MPVAEVENIISKISQSDDWELYALKYKHTKTNGTTYETNQINFRDRSDLLEHINTIKNEYCNNKLKDYESIRKYDGTYNTSIIYFLKQTNDMIAKMLQLLNESIKNSSINTNIDGKENAFIIQGTIEDDNGEEKLIKLITMRKPFTHLKNRFYFENGLYVKMNKKVLSLASIFDILIVGNEKVYFMNFNGEKLFNMERIYKGICSDKVKKIGRLDIVSNFDSFSQFANSGHNPRKFISYDSEKLKYVVDLGQRKNMAKKFNIVLDKKGKIDSSDHTNVNKFIKFLCNRAVLDPITLEPKESDGTRNWS